MSVYLSPHQTGGSGETKNIDELDETMKDPGRNKAIAHIENHPLGIFLMDRYPVERLT